jgi:hypothetical protein
MSAERTVRPTISGFRLGLGCGHSPCDRSGIVKLGYKIRRPLMPSMSITLTSRITVTDKRRVSAPVDKLLTFLDNDLLSVHLGIDWPSEVMAA